jgi:hypothetical protein
MALAQIRCPNCYVILEYEVMSIYTPRICLACDEPLPNMKSAKGISAS